DPVAGLGHSWGNDGLRVLNVFARGPGASGALIHYWFADGAWQTPEDLTAVTSGMPFKGQPFYMVGWARGNEGQLSSHVFARGARGDLLEYWWLNYLGWHFYDIAASTGGAPISDPVAIVGTQMGNNGEPSAMVYAKKQGSNDLLQYSHINYAGWTASNLT